MIEPVSALENLDPAMGDHRHFSQLLYPALAEAEGCSSGRGRRPEEPIDASLI